jgi:hypothetical protein
MNHISFTQMSMLLKCGIQYEFRYVKHLIIPPSASLVRGWVGHKAAEENFKQKIFSRVDMATEEIVDIYDSQWEIQKHSIAFTDEELSGSTPRKVIGKFKDSGIEIIKVFHKEHSPAVNPAFVEKKFKAEFEGGYPALVGAIDVVGADDDINEFKFVGKSPTEGEIFTDIQVTAYDYCFRNEYKRPPSKLVKRYAIANKIPITKIQEAPARDDETLKRFLFRLERCMLILEKGIFQPAAIGSWACSEKWCGYYLMCKFRP